MARIANTNDGSARPPRLRCYLAMGNLMELPAWSTGPSGAAEAVYAAVREAGYEGLQGGDPALCRKMGLGTAASERVNQPGEVRDVARRAKDLGQECITLHAGWGLESDAEVDALVHDIIETSAAVKIPLYIETHRATLTDDIWRTVQLVKRIPEIRFNGDFSHWYTGHEMRYGDIEGKFDFCQSVFDRVRFLHGRIGDPGSIQVGLEIADCQLPIANLQETAAGNPRISATESPRRGGKPVIPPPIGNRQLAIGNPPWIAHFRQMWVRSMRGFLADAGPGDFLSFTPELLFPSIQYARTFRDAAGQWVEESDRWQQALLLCRIARACFAEAQRTST